jgi:hypothetical protein
MGIGIQGIEDKVYAKQNGCMHRLLLKRLGNILLQP